MTRTVAAEHTYLKLYRTLTMVGGSATLCLLLLMIFDRGPYDTWENLQLAMRDTLLARATTDRDSSSAASLVIAIREIDPGSDSRRDRCITCHLGMVIPGSTGAPNPLGAHPADILGTHPVERFGCTLCHGGNGRDVRIQPPCTAQTDSGDSRESMRYIEASCGRCHGQLFDTGASTVAPVLQRGREFVRTKGCLGCHKIRMVGGRLGPDLTDQGGQSLSHYSFQAISGTRSVPHWLREHFREPARITPGSIMPPVHAAPDVITALVTYVLSLHRVDLPAVYYSLPVLAESRGQRSSLEGTDAYGLFCTACHGPEGRGAPYDSSRNGAPAIGTVGFQAVASDEFIQFMLMEGRGPRLMASWRPALSGLKPEELPSLVQSVRRWKVEVLPWDAAVNAPGTARRGRVLFDSWCAACHGQEREGGIGPRLDSKELLNLATDRFLYSTLAVGRANTAMPSWAHLGIKDLRSLVLFLRGDTPARWLGENSRLSAGDSSRGEPLYHAYCARCHGTHGEGGIGPAILNPDFLAAANDRFLAGTIKHGRSHTPMFGWSQAGIHLPDSAIAHLIIYMRSASRVAPRQIYPGATRGRPERGRELYRELCGNCHGINGEGSRAPALNNQEFLNAATNGFLLATITLGRPGTAMPAWSHPEPDRRALSQDERLDLAAFARIWQKQTIDREWVTLSGTGSSPRGAPSDTDRNVSP